MKIQPQFTSYFEHNVAVVQIAQTPVISPENEKNHNDSLIYTSVPIAFSIFAVVLLVWCLKSFLCICKPNEILILSGRNRRTKDGQEVGYRVLAGGRAIRIPILETIKRMDVTTIPVRVEVRNAYAKGRAVSFHKGNKFVNIMGEKSLSNCYGGITISTKQIENHCSNNGEICRSITHTYS
jgi:flotillin